MKRYYFDLDDGGWEPDRIGTDMADDLAAQRQAIRFAGEILRSEAHRIEHGEMRVNVRENTATLFSIVIRLERTGQPVR